MKLRLPRDDEQVQEIRRRMAALRQELKGDVRDVGRSARAMADWRYYVRRFPWVALAVAAAAGYFTVPKRKHIVAPDPDQLAELAKHAKLVIAKENAVKSSERGLLGGLLAIAATGAMRAGMAYVGQQLGSLTAKTGQETTVPARSKPTPVKQAHYNE